MSRERRFGTTRDAADHRDRYFDASSTMKKALPKIVDLREHLPPPYDQGSLNSCSANAAAGAIWFDELRQRVAKPLSPSRLFIYYNERAVEGIVDENAAVSLRDCYRTIVKDGACPEPLWPYDERKFKERPAAKCYTAAEEHKLIEYSRVHHQLHEAKSCLAAGFPFTGGFAVYESFKSDDVRKSGIVPLPKSHEKLLGGHAMLVIGYDETQKLFRVRNSWGADWGVEGDCFLPFEYFENGELSWDFWTVRKIR